MKMNHLVVGIVAFWGSTDSRVVRPWSNADSPSIYKTCTVCEVSSPTPRY
jgi:hypothetical protein